MPFVWNDRRFAFLDEDEYYNKADFIIARNLYVEFAPTSSAITSPQINRLFRKYGPLEKIEVRLGNGAQVYAYVTFRDSKDAYFALLGEEKKPNKAIQKICPAYSWKQPQLIDSPFLSLNDDCLLALSKYCNFDDHINLWQVCQRTRNFLINHVPSTFTSYHVPHGELWLSDVELDLQCCGQFIRSLTLSCTRNEDIILHFCSKYVGASIEELNINMQSRPYIMDENLQPILSRIKSLAISWSLAISNGLNIKIPNVEKLMLNSWTMNVGFLKKNCPKLTSLELNVHEISKTDMVKCLAKNPQLKELFINVKVCSIKDLPFTRHLEKLMIRSSIIFCNGDALLRLRKLRTFKWLALYFKLMGRKTLTTAEKRAISNLGTFKYLRTIILGELPEKDDPDLDQILIELGRNLPRLEHLRVNKFLEPSVIVEIIKNGPHLKTFSSSAHESYDFVKTIADIRKNYFGNASILNLEFILTLHGQEAEKAAIDSILEDTGIIKYVKVSCKGFNSGIYPNGRLEFP